MAALADISTEILALESIILRTLKLDGSSQQAIRMTQYYAAHAFRVIETSAEKVLGAVAEGDMLRTQMAILRRLTKHEPWNAVAIGREISAAVVEAGQYFV